MNFKYLISSASIVLLLGTACQKLTEDPKANLTPATYFKTQSDLDASVAAIYTELTPDFAFGFTTRMTSCFGADDLTTDPGLNKGDMRAFDELNGASNNASLLNQWQGPWAAVYQANNVLANYTKVTGSTTQALQQSAGQAYFLRAFSYYYLVRVFGPIPDITTAISASARPPRDSVSTIYTTIVSDLQMAASWLPATWPAGQPGRATSGAARALLADVYLTMTGWPLNQTQYYPLAAAEADSVINSGTYSLEPDFNTVFTTNNGPESIFALQFNVTAGVPERSYGSSSVPLDESGLDGSGGWDDYYPEINFYLNTPKCYRSYCTYYDTLKLLNTTTKTFTLVPWNSPLTHAGHPYYKKFRHGLVTGGIGDGVNETDSTILSINPSTNKAMDFIRYPMVLLDFAEADDMASGSPSAADYSAFNLVRARAGLPNLTPGLSQIDFRDSVVQERAWEFAGENGVRWFDIVRLQMLSQIIAARSPLENPINTTNTLSTRYLAPIPLADMNNDPNWTQNAGY
ncbi:MAG TPA: RagB/SusD family nutrient uptake outer membrane protein [Puia sp.]|nr:RagB/SusD family nutrient uptake outer membrane protein [Puia sp.]